MSVDLILFRATVDDLDNRIAELIRERILTARTIVYRKRALGLSATDSSRESIVISRVTKQIAVADRESIEQIYNALFREAKK